MNTHTDPLHPEFSGGYDPEAPDCPTSPSAGDKLSAVVAGFLIGGELLPYRLDLTGKIIDRQWRRTAAVPGSTPLTITNGVQIHSAVLSPFTFWINRHTDAHTQTDRWARRQVSKTSAYAPACCTDRQRRANNFIGTLSTILYYR